MALGPMLIFDKSTLQSLSPDESVWLENFYLTNITPLFYIETLADLEKQVRSGRTPEDVVGSIARKTPDMSSYPNVHHRTLLSAELQGIADVEITHGRVILGRGRTVKLGNETGVLFEQDPETEAFQRWQQGEFLVLERLGAKKWREALSNVNHEEMYQGLRHLYDGQEKPKTLAEVKTFSDRMINGDNRENSLRFGLNLMSVPEASQQLVLERYRVAGNPPIREFAPYFHYMYSVELFFYMAMAADLISRERASNKVDLAYLYYLPFCMVFTSSDNLHERMVPLFLREDQSFVKGTELKADLARLNELYSELPDEIKIRGTYRFAPYPPTEGGFLVSKLWDKHLPVWRKHQAESISEPIDELPKAPEGLIEKIQRFEKEATPVAPSEEVNSDNADHVGFKRRVSVYKGNWRRFPPEIEESAKDDAS